MNEHQSSEPAIISAGEKKNWVTPEIRDQSIKSGTTGPKGGWPTETVTSGTLGPAS